MAQCAFNDSTMYNIDLIGSNLAMLSLVTCVVAIIILIYYKLYRSFNYRLILYLLISFLIDAVGESIQLPLVWYRYHHSGTAAPHYTDLCKAVLTSVLVVTQYSLWNTQLFIAFMTAEVFSMILFSRQLLKAEIPLTLACFALPIIAPILQQYYGTEHVYAFLCGDNITAKNTSFHTLQYYAIPGMVIMGACFVAIATAMSCLAYNSLQWCFTSSSSEEQYLLHKHTRKRYKNALKESLPLAVYPITGQIVLLVLFLVQIECSIELLYIYAFICGSTGAIASTVFFIHVKALGRYKRKRYRKRSRNTLPINTVEPINEGQKITAIGSITATNVTDFDPPSESDTEPYT